MRLVLAITTATLLCIGCGPSPPDSNDRSITKKTDWTTHAAEQSNVLVRATGVAGGRFDITGDGALLLGRPDTVRSFSNAGRFVSRGQWTSEWLDVSSAAPLSAVTADVRVYGQSQNMATGWTKFSGNPLVSGKGSSHTTAQTLQLPDSLWPNDQALVRGAGPYENQWLLLFNVGGWAVGGWAAAVADSLAPLKRGENPFRLVDPYPLFTDNAAHDTLGYHAPNDWIYVDGTWYTPDESRDHFSRMWTSPSLTSWTNEGPIEGIQGHDPGMAYDGERFHLFTEDGTRLQHLSAPNPLATWTAHGVALKVGDHTGDADASFFNNAWHLFFDDAPHQEYTIGYARTDPSAFPRSWRLQNDIYGPRMPDQGQTWDEPTADGNNFGTGDPDLALEGTTLYLTHERPTGIAYKELDLTDDTDQSVQVQVEIDSDGDGTVDSSQTQKLPAGNARLNLENLEAEQVRLTLTLKTDIPRESPMVRTLRLQTTEH